MGNNAELEKAKMQMRNAQIGAPEEIPEENEVPQMAPPQMVQPQMAEPAMPRHQSTMGTAPVADAPMGGEVTVMDFMQATRQVQYVDMPWPSKNKTVKIKKFCKGELDKISAPFFQKTLKLDLTQFGGKQGQGTPMNFDISMELFSEMEKNMIELGMSFYKDSKGTPIITRHYIDNFMTSEDFQELSGIIQKVNPNALMTTMKQQEQALEVKNS